ATMNPIEQEGTYKLPEAQEDRFLLKIKVTYPSFDEEMEIVNRYTGEDKERKLRVVVSKEQLLDLQALTRQVPVSSDIKQFIVKLVNETRNRKDIIEYGASPRASTGLVLASKARALIGGRNHVSIEDVRAMAYPVLRHRIILNFEAERKGLTPDGAIKLLLDKIR
ncbi:MAG: MoxR family ATPase, partial [Nanoarchaeota archaeon]